jgi:hypothetical protein
MNFNGEAIKATEASIAVIAAELGVPYFRLRGVIEVEAPRGPFDRMGRPAMLFEPHHFYKRVRADRRDEAVSRRVAQPERPRAGQYPADSYPRLLIAMEIDEEAALQSCSWGRGQVMGFNYRQAGYRSVKAMVEAACRSESEQLRAMAGFIKSNGLVGALKRGDAAAFARGYNGAGYARDGYDAKIREAWLRWQKRPAPPVAREAQAEDPPKPMTQSREGNAAAAGGAIATVTVATEIGKQVQEATDTASGLIAALANPIVLGLFVIAGLAAAIWFWRRQRLQEHGV